MNCILKVIQTISQLYLQSFNVFGAVDDIMQNGPQTYFVLSHVYQRIGQNFPWHTTKNLSIIIFKNC